MRLSWRARVCGVRWCRGARSAAAQAQPRGLVGRSALRADSAAMLASGSHRRTRTAHCVRSARTTAASQLTKRAARADPDAALLAALKGPAAGPARRLRGCPIAKSAASGWDRDSGLPPALVDLPALSFKTDTAYWRATGAERTLSSAPRPTRLNRGLQPLLGRLQALRGERHRLRLAHRVGNQPLWRATCPWRRSRRTSRRGHPHASSSAATSARRLRGVRCPVRRRDAAIQAGTSASSGLCAPMPPTFRTWV